MAINLHPSGAETANGTGGAVPGVELEAIGLFVNVTAFSGTDTPTLTVKLQESVDGTNWADVTSFTTAGLTSTGLTRVQTPSIGLRFADKIRLAWTITGTNPSFTFTADLAAEDHAKSGS